MPTTKTLYLYELTQYQAAQPKKSKSKPDPDVITMFRRDHLPYGMWVTESRKLVLFNRHYHPIWECCPGHSPVPADKRERVEGIVETIHFYNGAPDRARRGLEVLKIWGIDPTKPLTWPEAEAGQLQRNPSPDPWHHIDINNLRARDVEILRERLWQLEIDALRAAMGCAPTVH
jgi:hypothetical protein